MTQLARGYSFVMYEYDPANLTYTIQFPFLRKEDVRVFVGEPGDYVEVSPQWVGPTIIKLPTETSDGIAIPTGAPVTVRRFTPRDKMLVNYKDGAQLPAADLNTASLQVFYIVQESIDFGAYGGSGLPGGGTGWSDDHTPTDPAIQEIIDKITQSEVFKELLAPIPDIDTNAQVILEEILRSQDYFDEYRKQGHSIAKAFEQITTIQTDTSAFAERITGVEASVNENGANIVAVQQAVADEASARASAIQNVQATTAATDARVQTIEESYATQDYAQAVAETKVDALASGAVAHIEERFEALAAGAEDPDGAFKALWTVRINAQTAGGKPVVGGIGLGADPLTGVSFVIAADQFAIIHPNYTAGGALVNVQYPFVVGTVGGVTQVGINGNLVVDKSIKANHLSVNSLSAISANMGTVNGGTFKTHTLDASGNIIDATEFRAEVSNVGTWPIWVGSGVKNQNNAVFWVDRDGNAGFDGQISAQNMIGNLQRQVAISVSGQGVIPSGLDTVVASWTLPAPVLLGETHVPYAGVMVSHDPCYNITAQLQYLSAGQWITIAKWSSPAITGSADARCVSYTESLIGLAPSTGANTSFRVLWRQDGPGGITFGNVSGACFGIR